MIQEKIKALFDPSKAVEGQQVLDELTKMFTQYAEDIKLLKERIRQKGDISPEEISAMETELKALRATLKEKDAELKKNVDALGATTQKLNQVSADVALRSALSAYQIAPEAVNDVFQLLSGTISIVDGAVVGKIVKDGKEMNVAVPEAVKHWSETSGLAKRVLLSSRTSGSGGQGSGQSNGVPEKKWSEMTLTERTNLYTKDPAMATQLMGGSKE